MKKPDAGILLKELILIKEAEYLIEGKLLKEHIHLAYESLKPINIIKSTFNGIFSATNLKTNAVNGAIGLATGFVAKKVFTGKSHNPLIKIFGSVLQFGISALVAKNPDTIKSVGGYILKSIFRKKETDSETYHGHSV